MFFQLLICIFSWLTFASAAPLQTKSGCQSTCGDVSIPYPFGIGVGCYQNSGLALECNKSFTPPRLLLGTIVVRNISLSGTMTIAVWVSFDCYNKDGTSSDKFSQKMTLSKLFTFSHTRNKFTAVGCDTGAFMSDKDPKASQYFYQSGCVSLCADIEDVDERSCSGIGCCQTAIPKGLKSLYLDLKSYYNHSESWKFNPCSYAFLADTDEFKFSRSDLSKFTGGMGLDFRNDFINETRFPAVVDWVVGVETCEDAKRNLTSYACGDNTDCVDSTNGPGYRCRCNPGYEGNPYFANGCQAKAGCLYRCGNVRIPYPFGVGEPHCYQQSGLELVCNESYNPPKLLYGNMPVVDISLINRTMTVGLRVSYHCYDKFGASTNFAEWETTLSSLFTFSDTRNKFTVIGCDTNAVMSDSSVAISESGCMSVCPNEDSIVEGSCSGTGCCQTAIPKGLKTLNVSLSSFYNHTYSWAYNPCSYAFFADSEQFKFSRFSRSDLKNFTGMGQKIDNDISFPAVLDWVVGVETCEDAKRHLTSYACGDNTDCIDSTNGPGYRCNCSQGYDGNPYFTNGCQDIDECSAPKKPCEKTFTNTPGSYYCSCPQGYDDLGDKDGIYCALRVKQNKLLTLQLALGLGAGGGILLLLFVAIAFWFYGKLKKRRALQRRQEFFKRNGGLRLQKQISSGGSNVEKTKIFVTEELEKATDNFNENRVLGRGGSGTVYKGMLPDGTIVAIKKSKLVDETQIGQFINELVILSEINHKNIVKVIGCCLETEVPLLVYEFVSRGTLSEHLHGENLISSISWEDRLRICKEIAGALAYLHSSLCTPIFHRDIKARNILLDENFKAKVSDFGISRSVPYEQTHLSTLVQGTFGYLDPEYFRSGQFTEKSDVYGFGVVLVELLTGQKPISNTRSEEEANLVMHFISSVKEDRVLEILETRIANEARTEEIQIVASLAKKCLKLVGRKRPTMTQVLIQLENLRVFQHQESLRLLTEK